MENQTEAKSSIKGGEKSPRLTRLEDFDENLVKAIVKTMSEETGTFDKITLLQIQEEEDIPEHKRIPTIKILGKEACSRVIADVEGHIVNIFPSRNPQPHLAYTEYIQFGETDSE